MGTNYYLRSNVCAHCGRGEQERHIGKSSGGWCFALHVYPDDGIFDLADWQSEFRKPNTAIYDEYGESFSVQEMEAVITERRNPRGFEGKPPTYRDWQHFHSANRSEHGPHGLLRHKVEQPGGGSRRESFTNGCIKHGEGTWDCIVGDFS